MASRRLEIYRGVQRKWLGGRIAPALFRKKGRFSDADGDAVLRVPFHARKPGVKRIWFHAASVGELEAIWSVIQVAAAAGPVELILTVFSESARAAVARLSEEVSRTEGCRVEFTGYSPWEGNWDDCLSRASPDVFVTAKYEAWPELWAALAERSIPLVIVGALSRRSLTFARDVCHWLGAQVPKMTLLASSPSDIESLAVLFPDARIEATGDPRWDRVKARSSKGNPRAAALIASHAHWPRPWGVLGSAWPADLKVWGELVRDTTAIGTLWVVPHRVDPASLKPVEDGIRSRGLAPRRTSLSGEGLSDGPGSRPACVLVDEMGFLSELYAAADWAYVGGGFGDGVHSTIEPALHGIPVAIGPAKAERFPEIAELRSTGQLTLVQVREQLAGWLSDLTLRGYARKSEWLGQAEARLGATDRVWRRISEAMGA